MHARKRSILTPPNAATLYAGLPHFDAKPLCRHLFDSLAFMLTGFCEGDTELQRVQRLILDHGGNILSAIDEAATLLDTDDSCNVIVLSKTERRTFKALFSLARGVPILHCSWVSECVSQKTLVPMQDHQFASWVLFTSLYPLPLSLRVFYNLCFHIHGSSSFQSNWTIILQQAGATICTCTGKDCYHLYPQSKQQKHDVLHNTMHCVDTKWVAARLTNPEQMVIGLMDMVVGESPQCTHTEGIH